MQLKITLIPYNQTEYTATKGDWLRIVRELALSHFYEMDIYVIESHIQFDNISVNDEVTVWGDEGILNRYLMLDIFESIEDREMNQ
jgi:hypothetical protein